MKSVAKLSDKLQSMRGGSALDGNDKVLFLTSGKKISKPNPPKKTIKLPKINQADKESSLNISHNPRYAQKIRSLRESSNVSLHSNHISTRQNSSAKF